MGNSAKGQPVGFFSCLKLGTGGCLAQNKTGLSSYISLPSEKETVRVLENLQFSQFSILECPHP